MSARFFVGAVTAAFIGSVAAEAQPTQQKCSAFGLANITSQIYYQDKAGWLPLPSQIDELNISETGRLAILYVVAPPTNGRSSGAVIVKSGRIPDKGTNSADRVRLVRQTAQIDPGCNAVPFQGKTSFRKGRNGSVYVSGRAYDAYHDFGDNLQQDSEGDTLRSFHAAEFRQGNAGCKRTDYDTGGFWRHVSTRGSFSYDNDVVDKGIPSTGTQLARRVGIFRSLQARPIYRDRRTEIKGYTTSTEPMCVRLTVPVGKRGSFLRINDLGAPYPLVGSRELRY